MSLSPAGESRIRGYLYVFERSLRTFLSPDVTKDFVREVESHIRARARDIDLAGDERAQLERILADLGHPLRVAKAYSLEMAVDEAVASGRFVPVARAVFQLAVTTVRGFVAAVGLFTGYAFGFGFLLVAALKPVFPQSTGLFMVGGIPRGFGTQFNVGPEVEVYGGYWIIPICVVIGFAILVITHRIAKATLDRWRERRALAVPARRE